VEGRRRRERFEPAVVVGVVGFGAEQRAEPPVGDHADHRQVERGGRLEAEADAQHVGRGHVPVRRS
jgi:hypothetical protein